MDDLITQVLSGAASLFEEERLKRWRDSNSENEEYFQEMAQVWKLTAPECVVPRSGPPTVEDILTAEPIRLLNRGRPGGGSDEVVETPGHTPRPWVRWGLLAASVAAVAIGIQVVGLSGPDPLATHRGAQNGSITVTLADGSFARLAEGSTLREWKAEGRREVSLDGKAFFAVARDEARPFVVRAGAGEVRVLGTRFQVDTEVDTEGDEVEAVVVEGLVRVSNGNGSVEVPAGSMARMGSRNAPTAMPVDDVFSLLSWPEGTLVFQATPLARVAEEVSRHYGRTLRIEGSTMSQRRVTAWFQGETFEAVAESLCIVTEAICQTESGNVTMGMGGGGGQR